MSSRKNDEELLRLLEEQRRQRVRDGLTEFIQFIDVPGTPVSDDEDEENFYPVKLVPAAHHELMIAALQAIDAGDIKRLMILMPPGSAKTTFATVCFPPWWLGRHPNGSLISVSYGSDLAKKFGRRCRSIVSSPEYRYIFGTSIRRDMKAADQWALLSGAEYMSSGILAGVTGNRGDGLVIDDPLSGREAADSSVIRNKTWDAYISDLRTRLKPNGFIVLILTRWHQEDPAGRILPENYNGETGWITARDGEQWYVLSLQAECESKDDPLGRKIGEYIWPEWFSKEHFDQEKITQGPRNWAALYQQRPAPEEGDFFRREWIQWYDWKPGEIHNGAPKHMLLYGASDYAVTKDSGDWTVHGVCGVDPNDDIYIIDWWREQAASDVWIEIFLDMMDRWETSAWGEEKGQILKSLDPFILKRMTERKIYRHRHQFPSAADKAMRAQPIRGRAAMKKLYLPHGAPWTECLVNEMMRFTGAAGDVDDQVDVLSLFGRMLSGMRGGVTPPEPPKTTKPTLDEVWKDHDQRQSLRPNRL